MEMKIEIVFSIGFGLFLHKMSIPNSEMREILKPFSSKRLKSKTFLLKFSADEYEDAYDDAYEDDVFTMEEGDGEEYQDDEEDEEDPEFYPDELLQQEMDTTPSPTEQLKKEEAVIVKSEPTEPQTDVKVIKCDLCDFVAENRTKFTAHMKAEHKKVQGTPKEKIFPCDLCDYKATSKAHVKAHKKTIHDKIKG